MPRNRLPGGRPARWWHSQPDWLRFLQALVLVPVVAAVLMSRARGYYPTFDDAFNAMPVLDILTGHPLVQGVHSTSGVDSGGIELHHPGPLYWYLLAPTTALFGRTGFGLSVGQGLIAAVSSVGAVTVAKTIGGRSLATGTAFACLLSGWAVGPEAWFRVFNPSVSPLVLPLVLLLAWALLLEHLRYLPHFAAATALAIQPHLPGLPAVAAWCLVLAAVGGWRWWRRRGRPWPLPGWRRRGLISHRRTAWLTVGVAGLVWLPSVVELVVIDPNNIENGWAYLHATRSPGVGMGLPSALFAAALSPWPPAHLAVADDLTFGPSMVGSDRLLADGAVWATAVLLLVSVALPLLARGGALRRSLAAGLGLLGVGVLAQAWALGNLSTLVLSTTWEHQQVWPLVHMWWAYAAYGIWRVGRERAPLGGPLAALFIGRVGRLTAAAVTVAVATTAVVGVLASPRRFDFRQGVATAAALPAIEAAVHAAAGDRGVNAGPPDPTHVNVRGDSWTGMWTLGWGVAYGLQAQGNSVHIVTAGQSVEDWEYRKYTTSPPDAVQVVLNERGAPPLAETGGPLAPVATIDPGGGRGLVAVYVFPGTPDPAAGD